MVQFFFREMQLVMMHMDHLTLLMKIKKRLRRYHRKLTDHRAKNKKPLKYLQANQYIIENPEIKNLKETSSEPVIIAENEDIIKTISVSEAIMLMNLKDQNVQFF